MASPAGAQLYNRNNPLRARSFWKTGIIMGICHGAGIFFIIYYSAVGTRLCFNRQTG